MNKPNRVETQSPFIVAPHSVGNDNYQACQYESMAYSHAYRAGKFTRARVVYKYKSGIINRVIRKVKRFLPKKSKLGHATDLKVMSPLLLGEPQVPKPKPRLSKPELLAQDNPLLGNKETVLKYLASQGDQLDTSALSYRRLVIVINYLAEACDEPLLSVPDYDYESCSAAAEMPYPKATDIHDEMEDYSDPEESDQESFNSLQPAGEFRCISNDQEVVTGYPKTIAPLVMEPLRERCATCAKTNELVNSGPEYLVTSFEVDKTNRSNPEHHNNAIVKSAKRPHASMLKPWPNVT